MPSTISGQPNSVASTTNEDYVQPIHRPQGLVYEISSTTADIFMIRAKIFIEGVNEVTIDHEATLASLSLATKVFEFNIKNLVQDFLNYNLQKNAITVAFVPNIGIGVEVEVEFYEITKVGDVITIAPAAFVTSNEVLAMNIARQYTDDIATTFGSKYLISDTPASGYQWLSRLPLIKQIGLNEQETMALLRNFSLDLGDTFTLSFVQLDSSQNILSIDIVDISASALEQDIGTGTRNMASWGIALNGNLDSYLIIASLFDSSDNIIYFSEARLYKIRDRHCDKTRLHFLNPFGRFEAITFEAGDIEQLEVSSKRYQKFLDTDFSQGDRGYEEARINSQEVHTAILDLFSNDVLRALLDMYRSPQVYVEETEEAGNATFIPVIITGKESLKVDENNIQRAKVKYFKAYDLEIQRN